MSLPIGLVDAVLAALRIDSPRADLAGLRQVYAAWGEAVPFDNVLKMLWLKERWPGRLPGSTPIDFFRDWIEYRTGGTCWAGNGALFALLRELGFRVERGVGTMLSSGPDTPGPNHGTVVVTLDEGRFVADASILSREPLRIPAPGESVAASSAVPRLELIGGRPTITWRTVRAPDGMPCRIDRVGVDDDEWNALHQRTATWSPFNYALSARLNRGVEVLGVGVGQIYRFDRTGALEAAPAERARRNRYLAEVLGIDASVAARVPEDRPVPPAPDGFRPPAVGSG